jgi:hypothetical protein
MICKETAAIITIHALVNIGRDSETEQNVDDNMGSNPRF